MLGGLQRDVHPVGGSQLARPHAGAVDDELRLDVAAVGSHPGDRTSIGEHLGDRDSLEDLDASGPCSGGQRHRRVGGIHPAVLGHVEAGEHVIGSRQREHVGDFAGRQLMDVDTEEPVERGHPAVLLEPVAIGGQFDEADRIEAGCQARL